MSFKTPSSRWSALLTRNPSAANAFIYAVISTKIYCRPNCPSRLARRANIIFYDTAQDAEAAGFRACKRCRPNENTSAGSEFIDIARRLLHDELLDEKQKKWSVKALAKECGVTDSHLCRVFKREVGVSVGGCRARLADLEATDPAPSDEMSSILKTHTTILIQESNQPKDSIGTFKSHVDYYSGTHDLAEEECFEFVDFEAL